MTTQQFIEKAIEGGCELGVLGAFGIERAILNPEAWKAVGKMEGWPEHNHLRRSDESKSWRGKFVGMSEHLADGFSIEQYLETL